MMPRFAYYTVLIRRADPRDFRDCRRSAENSLITFAGVGLLFIENSVFSARTSR